MKPRTLADELRAEQERHYRANLATRIRGKALTLAEACELARLAKESVRREVGPAEADTTGNAKSASDANKGDLSDCP